MSAYQVQKKVLASLIMGISAVLALALVMAPLALAPRSTRTFASGHSGPVRSLAWSPDGVLIASGDDSGAIRRWDADSAALRSALQGHDGAVNSLAFSPDSFTLLSGGADRTVRMWDTRTNEVQAILEDHVDGIKGLAWSEDGQKFASESYDQTAIVWSVASHKPLSVFRHFADGVQMALGMYDAAGQSLVFAGDKVGKGCPSYQKALDNLAAQQTILRGYGLPVNSLAWSPEHAKLAGASTNGEVLIWDGVTGALVTALSCTHATSLAWAPEGKLLAIGEVSGAIVLWDPAFVPDYRMFWVGLISGIVVFIVGYRVAKTQEQLAVASIKRAA